MAFWKRWKREEFKHAGLDPKFYACLGLVAAEWSRIEQYLGLIPFTILQVDAVHGEILTANLGFQSRLHAFQAFIPIFEQMREEGKFSDADNDQWQEFIDFMKSLVRELNELYAVRNGYVHAFWYASGSSPMHGLREGFRVKGRINLIKDEVHAETIMDGFLRMNRLLQKLMAVLHYFDQKHEYHDQGEIYCWLSPKEPDELPLRLPRILDPNRVTHPLPPEPIPAVTEGRRKRRAGLSRES